MLFLPAILLEQHLNPLKERELDLRAWAIYLLVSVSTMSYYREMRSRGNEHMLATPCDPSIRSLANHRSASYPAPRIRTIHAGLNNISTIAPNLSSTVPYLEQLVLTSNNLATFASLLPLANFTKLQHLSLIGNPVRNQKHYREWVIWKAAQGKLRTLDFKRIKDAERAHARSLFVDEETGLPSKLALSLTSEATVAAQTASAGTVAGAGTNAHVDAGKGRLMTAEEKAKIREAIQNASNIEEIRKLERMLAEGRVPEEGKA
ncbi:hypothetical protein QFC19_001822 [Naganishia cerealis]|uniref:Uncharacterized protein n=1 Tax=Naganishia cerealis TaxID=610337 RepID=A0ACC2WEG0_9TREE|nr:hypothetical protein QFC19_001822 [Naganishia cerealis]